MHLEDRMGSSVKSVFNRLTQRLRKLLLPKPAPPPPIDRARRELATALRESYRRSQRQKKEVLVVGPSNRF